MDTPADQSPLVFRSKEGTVENPRAQFYRRIVGQTITDRAASVLVVAASVTDKAVFEGLGLKNATFSNVDDHSGGITDFAPFAFSNQDAESLSFPDESFDYVVIHAALHHCHSPHRALLEMYRVARKGVLAFEARDSVLMRLLERLKLTEVYEHGAVYLNGGEIGGVRNGPLPNFIYRWTERDVEKTVSCFAPHAIHSYQYHYGNEAPAGLLIPGKSVRKTMLRVLYGVYKPLAMLFPRQQNLFAFCVLKPVLPAGSQPWVCWKDGQPRFNMEWGRTRFGHALEE